MTKAIFILWGVAQLFLASPSPAADQSREWRKPISRGVPDLTIAIAATHVTGPAFPRDDIRQRMRLTVENRGSAPAAAFTVEVFLSTHNASGPHQAVNQRDLVHLRSGKVEVHALAAGASLQVDFARPVLLPLDLAVGPYYVIAIADADRQVVEPDEKNNHAALPLEVWYRLMGIAMDKGGGESCHDVYAFCSLLKTLKPPFQADVKLRVDDVLLDISSFSHDILVKVDPVTRISLGIHDAWLEKSGRQCSNKLPLDWGLVTNSVHPESGPPGTSIAISCCNAGSRGTKKVFLRFQEQSYELSVTSWSSDLVRATVPTGVPPGNYYIKFKDQGRWISAPLGHSEFMMQ